MLKSLFLLPIIFLSNFTLNWTVFNMRLRSFSFLICFALMTCLNGPVGSKFPFKGWSGIRLGGSLLLLWCSHLFKVLFSSLEFTVFLFPVSSPPVLPSLLFPSLNSRMQVERWSPHFVTISMLVHTLSPNLTPNSKLNARAGRFFCQKMHLFAPTQPLITPTSPP